MPQKALQWLPRAEPLTLLRAVGAVLTSLPACFKVLRYPNVPIHAAPVLSDSWRLTWGQQPLCPLGLFWYFCSMHTWKDAGGFTSYKGEDACDLLRTAIKREEDLHCLSYTCTTSPLLAK